MIIVIVSGGFDPLHSGHLEYFKGAKKLGDKLVVGVNSDNWLRRKKGKNFLPIEERIALLEHIKEVDEVVIFKDDDNTAFNLILNILKKYPKDNILFANGRDRTIENIPEMERFLPYEKRLKFIFGIGGDIKKNSSSAILEQYLQPKTIRPWGQYSIIDEGNNFKVKELVINPGNFLSMQRHRYRSEHWIVVDGKIFVNSVNISSDLERVKSLSTGQSTYIPKNTWHQIENPTTNIPAKIIEIWIGEDLREEDIERR